MLAHLDAESVVLGAVKGTSVTGPTAATTEPKEKVDALILKDGRSTSELCAAVRTGKLAVMAVIREMATGILRKAGAENFAIERKAARKTSVQN